MWKLLILLTLLLPLQVFPSVSQGEVTCERMIFRDEALHLVGQVNLTTPLGSVFSDEIILYEMNGDQTLIPFKLAKLNGHVQLVFHDGATLFCDSGVLNLETQVCEFFSHTGTVQYIKDEEFTLDTKQLTVYLAPLIKILKDQAIERIVAEGEVYLSKAGEWKISGDRLDYHFPKEKNGLPGLFSLLSDDFEVNPCLLQMKDVVDVQALSVNWDGTNQLQLTRVSGEFSSSSEKDQPPISFRSDQLFYYPQESFLDLKGDVLISQLNRFNFYSDRHAAFYGVFWDRSFQTPEKVHTDGSILISYIQTTTGEQYNLKLTGTVTMNQNLGKGEAISENDKPVLLEAPFWTLQAGKLFLNFNGRYPDLLLDKLIAREEAFVKHKIPTPFKKSFYQYALADMISYRIQDGAFFLSSKSPRRVLMMDTANDIKASAPGFIFIPEGKNHPFKVNGKGDVRLILMDHEVKQLLLKAGNRKDKNKRS